MEKEICEMELKMRSSMSCSAFLSVNVPAPLGASAAAALFPLVVAAVAGDDQSVFSGLLSQRLPLGWLW